MVTHRKGVVESDNVQFGSIGSERRKARKFTVTVNSPLRTKSEGKRRRGVAGETSGTVRAPNQAHAYARSEGKFTEVVERQKSAVLRVLVAVHGLILREGWAQREYDLRGETPRGWSLPFAIAEAGNAGIECEWTRKEIRRFIGDNNIPAWNDHPHRTKADVLAMLERVIERAGGRPPRRGGWVVGGVK